MTTRSTRSAAPTLEQPPLSGPQRVEVGFVCPQGHRFELLFHLEAELPTTWDCLRCGRLANRADGTPAPAQPADTSLTHWDRLLQRRSLAELEELLSQRLAELRQEL
ncbi:MAG: RNA polymerase-binding protein RbpA [Propionibacteriaceae bacterium]|nr:RNA polymerase-binding protein RbpA [Propionibacteriaceae bacterium]